MYTLTITAQDATTDITRREHFGTVEAADARRTFLKSIERFGSSNLYSINPTDTPADRQAHLCHLS